MYGIPGFAVDDAPRIEREPLSEADAVEVVRAHWCLDAERAMRLESERDDTMRIRTPRGDYVLKVAHPADDPRSIDFQTKALAHAQANDPGLPLQRITATPDGVTIVKLAEHQHRLARLFSWLPGELLADTTADRGQLVSLGSTLGRLSLSLTGFSHDAQFRPFAWDVMQVGRLRALAVDSDCAATTAAIDQFETDVVPLRHALPMQVIQGDFHQRNILVSTRNSQSVTGILDFGDVIYTTRVADVAIALSYQLFPRGQDWESAGVLVDAFERHVALTAEERAVLRPLVAARFAQRILINDWLCSQNGVAVDSSARAHCESQLTALLERP